jgi:hypothetical protein
MNNSASNHNQNNEAADQSSQKNYNNNNLDRNSPTKMNLIQKPKADKNGLHDCDNNITKDVGWKYILALLIYVVGILLLLYFFYNVTSKFFGNIREYMLAYMFKIFSIKSPYLNTGTIHTFYNQLNL